jgi:hypothetical protein
MTKRLLLILLPASLLAACNNSDTSTPAVQDKDSTTGTVSTDTASTKMDTAEAVNSSCYTQVTDKDTVNLHLVRNGDKVSGDLQYRLFEKDMNTGTITGLFRGDTLIADYTFSSEGRTSVREVAFLKKGDDYTEGFGMVRQQKGKAIFRPGTLQFSDSLLLKKVDCP